MPLLESDFKSKLLFRNKHFSTIYPNFFKKDKINYQRERIITPDNDFLDLDTLFQNSDTLVIGLHGLEGSSQSSYMTRLATISVLNKFDFIAINHRGCSGEPNKLLGSYHSGKTDDLDLVISLFQEKYQKIYLVGYSLGGNVLLKYLGEKPQITDKIKSAVAISVPIDLKGCAIELKKTSNKVYMERFLKSLRVKAIQKVRDFHFYELSEKEIMNCKSFFDFDDLFTAPTHGFKSAEEYWAKSSSRQFLPLITVPTMLLSAQNDPFLSDSCFPFDEAKSSHYFHLEAPQHGGHVGFVSKDYYWLEKRIFNFLDK